MKNTVFLSYSYEDQPWVAQFVATLEQKGLSVWFDKAHIELGESIHESIAHALRESNTMVVVLSSNSVRSKWIYFELGAAVADGKRIIPIIIDDTKYQDLPLPLVRYQYLQEKSPVQAGDRVAQAITEAE